MRVSLRVVVLDDYEATLSGSDLRRYRLKVVLEINDCKLYTSYQRWY